MRALVFGVTLVLFVAFMHQGICKVKRNKRSPQRGGRVEFTEDAKAKQVIQHYDKNYASPGEFHKLVPGDVTFTLVTRYHRSGILLDSKTIGQVKNKKTIISVAGWADDTLSPEAYNIPLTDAYLEKGDYNIILVHAVKLMFYPEPVSASYTEPIGKKIADLICCLNEEQGVYLSNIHIIGHALGAHIAGAAGCEVKRKSGRQIYRISALEVSKEGFEGAGPDHMLDPSDAKIVDVYHTAAGQLGLNKSVGRIDFWPNGGIAPQPLCPVIPYPAAKYYGQLKSTAYCSYDKSIWYYIYTINTKEILGRRCSSYDEFLKGNCDGNSISWYGDNYGGQYSGNQYLILDCVSAAACTATY